MHTYKKQSLDVLCMPRISINMMILIKFRKKFYIFYKNQMKTGKKYRKYLNNIDVKFNSKTTKNMKIFMHLQMNTNKISLIRTETFKYLKNIYYKICKNLQVIYEIFQHMVHNF